MKVGIAGAGGLGSNIAVHLIRAGVLDFKIVDFDVVEETNLNRQFYFRDQLGKPKVDMLKENLRRIAPTLQIETINKKLDKNNIRKVFSDCEIIAEAFDGADTKVMLIEAFAGEIETGAKFVVCASGIAGLDTQGIGKKTLGENLVQIGDFSSDVNQFKLYSSKVSAVAGMMASVILERMGFRNE